MESTKSLKHYRVCNLCEAMCGLEITHNGTKVLSIKGDKNDPFSQGHICPKAVALQDIYEDPNRLKKPIKKVDNTWVEISWKAAFDEIDSKIKAIREKYGKNAIASYLGNPTVHNSGSLMFMPAFLKGLSSQNTFTATSVDQLPHHFAAAFMFGHSFRLPVPDIDRTEFMLIMGANPVASNGSLMTAPGVAKRLKNIQERGGKVIVIDPRKTETALIADEHHFIYPSTDVFLLLAMLQLIFENNWVKLGRFEKELVGFEQLKNIFQDFTPELVAQKTGISATTITALTKEFVKNDKAVCYGRMGLSTQKYGGLCQWLINLINLVTGNLDEIGGAMFPKPALDFVGNRSNSHKFGRWHSRVSNLPEFIGELPVSVMAEEMLTEGEGQVKALITNAGNPVLSTPNGQQLEKALEGLEFMVSIDIYLNETTKHADIILPPATGLESDHYDVAFHALAVRNTTKYSPVLFEPAKGMKQDWEILKELTKRLALKPDPMTENLSHEMMLDFGLTMGPYEDLNLEKVKASVHGIDLGPLEPRMPEDLLTADKKIHVALPVFLEALAQLKNNWQETENLATSENGQFRLIGRRHLRSNNSWMHNSERLVKGRNRCTLMMHSTDAERLNLEQEQTVEVRSVIASVKLPVEITDDIMPGVVSIPHGYGHHRKGTKMPIAEAHAGISINDLTDEKQLDELTGNAAFSGQLVNVFPVSEFVSSS